MTMLVGGIKLHSFDELSQQMGVTVQTLHGYRKKKQLKAKSIGGVWVVSEDNLRDFLNSPGNQTKKRETKGGNMLKKERCDFPENVSSNNRFYPVHSGEEKDTQAGNKKIKDYLEGKTQLPQFRRGKGTFEVSKMILRSDGRDIREVCEEYKAVHPQSMSLPQGKYNAKDRFLRMLSGWTEAGAISVSNYIIHFEDLLKHRLESDPDPMR